MPHTFFFRNVGLAGRLPSQNHSSLNKKLFYLFYLTFVHKLAMFVINEHIEIMNENASMKLKRGNKEAGILKKALEAFKQTTNLNATIRQNLKGPDAEFEVLLNDKKWKFAVEVKENVTRTLIGILYHKRLLSIQHAERVLVTRYINPKLADLMKEDDIPFIDTAGNAYINKPPLFIFVKGNKIREKDHVKPPARAFRPAGLQVIFALLTNKDLENATYREIARKAGVALGTVDRIMRDLRQMGYLIEMGKRGRRLTDKFNLFIRWVNAYPEELRPKKLIGRYRADTFDWWKQADIEKFQAYWGGEIAAAMLTKYLKPEKIAIYTRQPLGELMLKHKIRKDPKGNIEIYEVFWEFEYPWKHKNIVPPILIYADLLATGDKRNIETADIVYEQEIDRFIRKD